MHQPPGPKYADNANEHPEDIEDCIRFVLLKDGAPRQQDSIYCVDNPCKHERTLRPKPTDEAEAENSHQYSCHLYRRYVPEYELIDGLEAIGWWVVTLLVHTLIPGMTPKWQDRVYREDFVAALTMTRGYPAARAEGPAAA
jgi:hypothetical protein